MYIYIYTYYMKVEVPQSFSSTEEGRTRRQRQLRHTDSRDFVEVCCFVLWPQKATTTVMQFVVFGVVQPLSLAVIAYLRLQ